MKTISNFELTLKKVDNWRFITRLNTQVRNLATLSQIVKILGDKPLPKVILKTRLEKWSAEEEEISLEYRNRFGKVTHNGKPTTAFERYLNFTTALGLITTYQDTVICSRLGKLLRQFTTFPKDVSSQLNVAEKLFFLFTLFKEDADSLILVLELLYKATKPVRQKELQSQFEGILKKRLQLKQKIADKGIMVALHNQYQRIEHDWKNPKRYAEHIIPPRLAWLNDLGLVDTNNYSTYDFTSKGKDFLRSLPNLSGLEEEISRDINEAWLKTKSIGLFSLLLLPTDRLRYWPELPVESQQTLLKPILEDAFNILDAEGAWRFSLNITLIFIAIHLAYRHNVVAELQVLEDVFISGITIGRKHFSARVAARTNEGYITVKLV